MRRDRRRKLSAVWRDGALGKAVSSTALAREGHSTFGGQCALPDDIHVGPDCFSNK